MYKAILIVIIFLLITSSDVYGHIEDAVKIHKVECEIQLFGQEFSVEARQKKIYGFNADWTMIVRLLPSDGRGASFHFTDSDADGMVESIALWTRIVADRPVLREHLITKQEGSGNRITDIFVRDGKLFKNWEWNSRDKPVEDYIDEVVRKIFTVAHDAYDCQMTRLKSPKRTLG